MILVGAPFGDGVVVADAGILSAVIHGVDLDLFHILHVHGLCVEVLLLDAVHAHVDLGGTLTRHGDPKFISRLRLDLRHGGQHRKRRGVRVGRQGRKLVLLSAELRPNFRPFRFNN